MGKASRAKKERRAVADLSHEERYAKGLCLHCGLRPHQTSQGAVWCAECALEGRRRSRSLRSARATRASLEASLNVLDERRTAT